jgi:hypothetical protein
MVKKKSYTTIKKLLKAHIKINLKSLWTWEQGENENFTCIYKAYDNELQIYTPQQLLNKLDEEIN